MKRFTAGLFFGMTIGLILASTTFAIADNPIKLIVNGQEIACDSPPQIINGRIMVPARNVAEPLGATVNWDRVNQTVNISGSGYATTSTQTTDTIPSETNDLNICKEFLNRMAILSNALTVVKDPNANITTIETNINDVTNFLNDVDQWNVSVYFQQIQIDIYQSIKNTILMLNEKQNIINKEESESKGRENISLYLKNLNEYLDALNIDRKVLMDDGLVQ